MSIELGSHQIKALKEIKNGSIIKGGVGTGKTRTALAYYYFHVIEAMAPINGVRGTYTSSLQRRNVTIKIGKRKRYLSELVELPSIHWEESSLLSTHGTRSTSILR